MSASNGGPPDHPVAAALGALSDWLELVREHENERRARRLAEARARRDHATRLVMALLSLLTLGLFFWLSRR